jgi:hypothetical protein
MQLRAIIPKTTLPLIVILGISSPTFGKTLDCTFGSERTDTYNSQKLQEVSESYIPLKQQFVITGDNVKMRHRKDSKGYFWDGKIVIPRLLQNPNVAM